MTDDANDVRGEVDIVLDGQRYVLRPSYTAIVVMEKKAGKPLLELAALAEQGLLMQETQAIVVTELVRAWGRELVIDEYSSAEDKSMATTAKGANVDAMGQLLFSTGTMSVQPRLSVVLGMACTGGVTAEGKIKATGEMTTPETLVADLQE